MTSTASSSVASPQSRMLTKTGAENDSKTAYRPISSASAIHAPSPHPSPTSEVIGNGITLEPYRDETQLALIQSLIDNDLSEPYSIFTYRYFITQWPCLCRLAVENGACVGVVVCKQDVSRRGINTGYIAMLAVRSDKRNHGLGSALVRAAIESMIDSGCQQVTLEAEVTNKAALKLYDNLGFIRDKRLERYYLNGNDAFRLKLRLSSLPASHYIRY